MKIKTKNLPSRSRCGTTVGAPAVLYFLMAFTATDVMTLMGSAGKTFDRLI